VTVVIFGHLNRSVLLLFYRRWKLIEFS